MTLSQIIQSTADRMRTVTVHVQSIYGTVTISDDTGVQDDIFLQGDDGSAFCSELDQLWDTTGDLDRGTIALHLAEPYTSCLWN